MRSTLVSPCKPLVLLRIALSAALTLLLSGWSTCNALFVFNSCQSSVPEPQISSLSPGTISGGAESVLLTVAGSAFVSQSQIMWNGNALQTTFLDSRHLRTTITQETFDSFGGATGGTVEISVRSLGSVAVFGCANGGSSATLFLPMN